MSRRNLLYPLAGLLAVVLACSDGIGPAGHHAAPTLQADVLGTEISAPLAGSNLHFLKQSAAAPALETYQVSFWAVKGKAASVTVKYLAVAGQSAGGPTFLQFGIPKNGLVTGAGGARLRTGDSVLVTLSIDPTTFQVDFEPSGVQFSDRTPATLQVSYVNADPDLNADGVVDDADAALVSQLDVWYQATATGPWVRLASLLDPAQKYVVTSLYHFSGYGVSW